MLSTPCYHLKSLSVHIDFKHSKEILATLCICICSPNLQELMIESIFSSSDGDDNEEEVFTGFGDLNFLFNFNHLEFVGMDGISGKLPELEFIRLLLATAPLLDTMSIKIDIRTTDSKKSRIFEDLTQFHRASAGAEIVYF